MKFTKQLLALFLSYSLVLAAAPQTFAAQPRQSVAQPAVHAAQPTPEQLQQPDETGAQELGRRIAENEATAIEVCEEFALSETEGNSKLIAEEKAASEDPITRFAQSLATAATTKADSSTRAATDQGSYLFHGYYFRRLTENSVPLGVKQKGLALVAYPADYRWSGIKTFLVTREGIVFDKDLGPDTTMLAPTITFRTSGWRPAE